MEFGGRLENKCIALGGGLKKKYKVGGFSPTPPPPSPFHP